MSAYRINTENLCVGYDGRVVVTDIDLKLEGGQIMTLIGPNGAGKSTILKTITHNLRPLAGTVYLDSRDLLGIKGEELAKKLSIVMTERLSGELMSCFDAAATGRYPYTGRFGTLSARDREIVRAALSRVDAEDLSDLPFDRVSDGQRQRVMLARALCQQPEVIILDEPTSFLDIRHKTEFLSLLRRMVREEKLAVIMSLHELDLALRVSDIIVCVNRGKIERAGAPEKVLTAEYVSELYSLPVESFNPLYATTELGREEASPRVFVIGGGGSGAAAYRRLSREGVPFAAGILHENDAEYALAKALASEVISERAFEPVGEAAFLRALEVLRGCEAVYCPLNAFGSMNEKNRLLKAEAERLGILR